MKCAIYARVSTDDKGQDPLNQLLQLREFALKQGWEIAQEYTDEASAKNGDRAGFKAMWKDVEAHKWDCLIFWSLDRLTREGSLATLMYLRRLKDHGVAFKSYTESYIDSLGVFGDAIVGILAAIAQQERIRLSDRTKAGLARARAEGKRIGRQRIPLDVAEIERMHNAGDSLRGIANMLGVAVNTIQKARRGAGQPSTLD